MSIRNPYRRRSQALATLEYTLDGESKIIRGDRYRNYQEIFNKLSVDQCYITDEVAMNTLEISSLSHDELETLYDCPLNASYNSVQLVEPSEEVLNREEFFILLSELQTKLKLDHVAFRDKFCPNLEPPRPRRNPFSKVNTSHPSPSTIQSSPSSSHSSFYTGDDKEIITVASPTRLGKTASVYFEKEVVASVIPDLPKKEPLSTEREFIRKSLGPPPQKTLAPVIETTTEWTCPSCAFTNPSNCTYCTVCVPKYPAPRSTMGVFAVVPQANMRPRQAEHQQFVSDERGAAVMEFDQLTIEEEEKIGIASGFQEVVQPITEALKQDGKISVIHETEFDKAKSRTLARSLLPEPYEQPKQRSSSFLSKSGQKPSLVAPSGYFFRDLASQFERAAVEGNISLLAALYELGADVSYSNPRNSERHNAINQAVEAKQEKVVRYLLTKGTDKPSATLALRSAIRMNLVHTAMELVPHADFTQFAKTTFGGFDSTLFDVSESCEAMAARMKSTERMELLHLMFKQKSFQPEKEVIKAIKQGKKRSPGIIRIMTMLDLFSYLGNLEGVKALLNRLGEQYRIPQKDALGASSQSLDPLCYLQAHNWESNPQEMLQIAQLLVKHGAQAKTEVDVPIGPEITPIASAVLGKSLQGVKLLLHHRANPESAIVDNMARKLAIASLVGVAAAEGLVDICRALVDNGVVAWQVDKYGNSPLYYACCGGDLDTVQYFLSFDTKRSDINGCLTVAVRKDNLDIVRALVTSGAKATHWTWLVVMAKDPAPQDRAKYFELIDALLESECSLHPELVLMAIDRSNYAGLSRLLQKRNGVLNFKKNAIFSDGPKARLSLCGPLRSPAAGTYKSDISSDKLIFKLFLPGSTSSTAAKDLDSNGNAFEIRPVSKESSSIFGLSRLWSWNLDRYNCMDYAIKEKAIDMAKLLRTWNWEQSTIEERLKYWLDENLSPINHKQRSSTSNGYRTWAEPPQLPPDLPLAAPYSF